MSIQQYGKVIDQVAEDLVTRHAALVKRIACHLAARLPPSVDVDDLIQAGMLGLLDAARKYSASRGATFETYAGIRIRGAMMDELRSSDWLPRSVHRRTRDVAQAIRSVEAREGREARPEQVAAELGMSIEEYSGLLAEISCGRMFSLDELRAQRGELPDEATEQGSPPVEFEQQGFRKALAEQVAGLPEREKLVLSLYYEQELNLREIGEVLGITESRVCQIHGQALARLRARMSAWLEE